MRLAKAVLASLVIAACGGSKAAATAKVDEPTPDAGGTITGPGIDTSDPPAPPPSDAQPCPKSPCFMRPVIFIHGHTGGIQAGKNVMDFDDALRRDRDRLAQVIGMQQVRQPRALPVPPPKFQNVAVAFAGALLVASLFIGAAVGPVMAVA